MPTEIKTSMQPDTWVHLASVDLLPPRRYINLSPSASPAYRLLSSLPYSLSRHIHPSQCHLGLISRGPVQRRTSQARTSFPRHADSSLSLCSSPEYALGQGRAVRGLAIRMCAPGVFSRDSHQGRWTSRRFVLFCSERARTAWLIGECGSFPRWLPQGDRDVLREIGY